MPDLSPGTPQSADLGGEVARERERIRQLFLAYAYDFHGWKMKDGSAESVREMLEDIDSGAEAHVRYRFCESDPDYGGMPTIREERET